MTCESLSWLEAFCWMVVGGAITCIVILMHYGSEAK